MTTEIQQELQHLGREVQMMRDTVSGHDASRDQIVFMLKYVDDRLQEILRVTPGIRDIPSDLQNPDGAF